jgi:hypothetical protein
MAKALDGIRQKLSRAVEWQKVYSDWALAASSTSATSASRCRP